MCQGSAQYLADSSTGSFKTFRHVEVKDCLFVQKLFYSPRCMMHIYALVWYPRLYGSILNIGAKWLLLNFRLLTCNFAKSEFKFLFSRIQKVRIRDDINIIYLFLYVPTQISYCVAMLWFLNNDFSKNVCTMFIRASEYVILGVGFDRRKYWTAPFL